MHARIRVCLCLHPCVCLYVPVSVRMCVSATGTHTDDMRGPVFPTKAYPLSLQLASSSPCFCLYHHFVLFFWDLTFLSLLTCTLSTTFFDYFFLFCVT